MDVRVRVPASLSDFVKYRAYKARKVRPVSIIFSVIWHCQLHFLSRSIMLLGINKMLNYPTSLVQDSDKSVEYVQYVQYKNDKKSLWLWKPTRLIPVTIQWILPENKLNLTVYSPKVTTERMPRRMPVLIIVILLENWDLRERSRLSL